MEEAQADVRSGIARLNDLRDAGEGKLGEALRPLYIDYLAKHPLSRRVAQAEGPGSQRGRVSPAAALQPAKPSRTEARERRADTRKRSPARSLLGIRPPDGVGPGAHADPGWRSSDATITAG